MRTIWIASLVAGLVTARPGSAQTVVHISRDGKDDAAGTAAAPIRTLGRLERLLSRRADVTEVVSHQGVYRGSLSLPVPRNVTPEAAAKLPPLLLRAADGEEAILDGARPIEKAEPVGGRPGVYVVRDAKPFRHEAHRKRGLFPSMWDGRPPSEHNIEVSRLDVDTYGLCIRRPNVTVRGLRSRNYHRSYNHSAGIAVRAANVTVEECHVRNCPRGLFVYGPNARIVRCRADDCGCGALVDAVDALVEACTFIRVRDDFMVPMALQEAAPRCASGSRTRRPLPRNAAVPIGVPRPSRIGRRSSARTGTRSSRNPATVTWSSSTSASTRTVRTSTPVRTERR